MTTSTWRIRLLIPALFVALVAASLAVQSPAQAQEQPRKTEAWSDTDCSTFGIQNVPADSGVECGYVTVPLRHAEPDGPGIQLGIVVIPSNAPDRKPDPLFMAQGGPGGSTITTYAQYLIQSPESNPAPDRDIVLWEERGTLHTRPALTCPEVSQANLRHSLAGAEAPQGDGLGPYRDCGERLEREAGDLSAFNSAENADDAESIRAVLGYDEFNFYGVSYGTELGQFIMRRQPENLRSVILDAVVPLTYNLYTEPAFAQQRIAEKYFDACAQDPRCDEAFPNLSQRYLDLVDRLNKNPITLTVSPLDPSSTSSSGPYRVRLTGSTLESALYGALYGADIHDLVPLIIDQADKGDYTLAADLLLPSSLFDKTMAEGMYHTVTCAERGDTNPDAADYSELLPRLAKQSRAGAEQLVEVCEEWQIELLPRGSLELVESDVPVLLLSGEFDPITPPEYAEQLLPSLPNSQHVVFSLGAHGQAVTSPCANGIITNFLDDPTARVDGSCADAKATPFETEEDAIFIPALQGALSSGGIGGLLTIAFPAAPGLLGVLALLTVFPAFALAWIVGRFSRRDRPAGRPGWTLTLSRAAPWLAALTAVVLLVFFIGLGLAGSTTLQANQTLFLLGAIDDGWRWLFWLPPLSALLVLLMAVTTVALWAGRHRSVIMRVYYTLLTLAGIAAVASLFLLGVMGLAFG